MKLALLTLALILTLSCYTFVRLKPAGTLARTETTPKDQTTASSLTGATKIDFATQVKPILQAKCQPCHFSGGVMYQRLPFDRPETIKTLGTKVFTRIKDDNERRIIREFLSQ